jgi:Fe2+ transport system protein FeoA
MTVCALCGFAFDPGGSACAACGCPWVGTACRTLDCPRCRYAVPDEAASRAARWIRRLFAPAARQEIAVATLADLRPGADGIVDRIAGGAALAARLTAQGLAPGVAIHLVQRNPSFVVEVGPMTLALERRVADAIRLRPGGTAAGTALAP